MTIIKKHDLFFIFTCLLCSAYNDWIRIPNTPISLYRLFLPTALILCLWYLKRSGFFILWCMFFVAINLLQNLVFFNLSGISTDPKITFTYFTLYLSIISIFLMVKFIRHRSIPAFKHLLFSFLPKVGLINLIFYWLTETPFNNILHLANRNNYAISLVAIFPFFFLKGIDNSIVNILYCSVIIFSLAIIGSKSAFFGVCLEIALILSIKLMKRIRYGNRSWVISLILAFCAMSMIVHSPLAFNGHTVSDIVSEFTHSIISGELYPDCNSSARFRSNAIVYMTTLIRESNGMGIGIGNTSVYLAALMPKVDEHLQNQPSEPGQKILSPHFALLEFISDCGLWAIVLLFSILKSALKKFMNTKNADFMDLFFLSFTLSFPIWCMSASGVYTIYYLFIVMACFYEWYQLPVERKDSIYENRDFCDRA